MDVEPHTAWNSEQGMLSLAWDDRGHIVLHLHKYSGKGWKGYAVVLRTADAPNSQLRRWEYGVFGEDPEQPRSYEFYSTAYRFPAGYEGMWTSNIKVKEGEPVRTEKAMSLRMIDIEHSNDYFKEHIDVQHSPNPKGGILMTEMARWEAP